MKKRLANLKENFNYSVNNNKIFIIVVIILLIYLFANGVFNFSNSQKNELEETTTITEIIDNNSENTQPQTIEIQNSKTSKRPMPKHYFSIIDTVIFGSIIIFCLYKIYKEKQNGGNLS